MFRRQYWRRQFVVEPTNLDGDDIKELKVYPSGGLFDKITTSMMKNKTSSGLCIRQFKKYSIEKFYARDFTGDKKK